jgi:hypothetical protein
MYPRPRLITELVTLTRPWGWTLPDLANELHVSLASLGAYRCGRRQLSMDVYSRVVERFGDYRIIRDAAYEYARTYHAPVVAPTITPAENLPIPTVRALTRFVERFPDEALRGGGGLLLVAREPRLLAAAVAHLRALFAATNVAVPALRADQSLSASETRDALAAPLLIIERVDFLNATVTDLLRRREEIVRPTIATSTTTNVPAVDEGLQRIFRARMRPLVIPEVPSLPAKTRPRPSPSPTLAHAAT